MINTLHYGDSLHVLRNQIASDSIDLVYLDPPFNSKRDYNLLFKSPKEQKSDAQITAFEDTWHWGQQAEDEFREVLSSANTDVAELMRAFRSFLKENDMMAYLTFMANRLLELHRVLKPTGSLYLHCDPTASHYLKLLLDAVHGVENFRNEIVWRRSNPKNHITQNFSQATDSILRYSKTLTFTFHQPFEAHDPAYVAKAYRYDSERGRYRLLPLLNPNDNRPNLTYEFLGVRRVWRWTRERMQRAYEEGLVVQLKPGAVPQYKKYLEDSSGRTITNLWADIEQVAGNESLGYPTQKPLSLLERIVSASSNPGDVVLDPFCGCGTAVHAAQKLGRRWIGIDITHLAVSLIERRMKQSFPGIAFRVEGRPGDIGAARDLAERDKHQFQLWACTLVGAQPYRGGKKGADGGIDGLLWAETSKGKTDKIIVQIKGGAHVTRSHIATLKGDVDRENAAIGLFVTLAPPTREMLKEAAAAGHFETPHLHKKQWPRIQILTIEGLLSGEEKPEFPDLSLGDQTFKAAKKAGNQTEQGGLF